MRRIRESELNGQQINIIEYFFPYVYHAFANGYGGQIRAATVFITYCVPVDSN